MSAKNARVTIEVTERELRYLMDAIGYPNSRFPQLQHKLGNAAQEMREAKRAKNREAKIARTEKRLERLESA